MVGSSKILTVSYGTFSCTLEGFDDPFGAMRSIAEYFRDLAAEDRYFGAEPPTPDAEMLHNIAQQEVERRVESRVQDNGSGIVLRQVTAEEVADEAPEQEQEQDSSPFGDTAEPEFAAEPAPIPEEVPDTAEEEDLSAADSVAAKLSRIRAVVERAKAAAPDGIPVMDDAADDGFEPDADFESLEIGESASDVSDAFAEDIAAAAEDIPEMAAEADLSDEDYEEDVATDDLVADAAVNDSIDAAFEDAEFEPEEAESEFDGEDFDEEDDMLEETSSASDVIDDETAEADPVEDVAEEDPEIEDEELDSMIAAISDEDDSPEGVTVETSDSEAEAEVMDDAVAEIEADDLETDDDAVDAISEEDAPAEPEEQTAETDEANDEGFDAEAPVLETASDDDVAPEADDDETSELTSEDEVEAEAVTAAATEDAPEEEENKEATAAVVKLMTEQAARQDEDEPKKKARKDVLIAGDPDVAPSFDRILDKTNTKMAESEGTRRRSAIAHLKAAVAATKADRLLKRDRSGEADAAEQNQYREDLAKVVRPRPSEPRENAADREAEKAKTANGEAQPLMLVSSQRIDGGSAAPGDADEEAVRPRRIGAGMLALDQDQRDEEEDDDESEFIAFAQNMGARDLPDLLEAAAAFTSFVERQPHFSRPQIMRRAASIETEEEFTREAGLRSFGQLLRQGRIRKLQRGQFMIPETTRFNPESSRIAGE